MVLSSDNRCSFLFCDLMFSLYCFYPSLVSWLTVDILPASTGVSLSTLLLISNERSCLV